MSGTQDDYGQADTAAQEFVPADDTEPADPETVDHTARRSLPLAPDSVKQDRIPNPFLTDNGRVLTVEEAGETYLKIQRTNWKRDDRTSKYERHQKWLYPRLLEADRHFQTEYQGLTTAMLSRRLSPIDDDKDWLTPWECNEMLHGGSIHRSIGNALNYHLGEFKFEWAAVTAPTRSAGTPHEHIYLWIDDPRDRVTTGHIAPALDKHLKHCNNAYKKHHKFRADGMDGAITVQYNPDRSDLTPEGFWKVRGGSQTYEKTGQVRGNTAGAQYLASQLTHLPISDYYNHERETPPTALFEGAALAWVSPYNWFRSTRGVK